MPGYPGYQASSRGRMRSCRNNQGGLNNEWHVLRPTVRKGNGYLVQTLKQDGVSHQRHLHQWIALAFYGPPEPLQQVRHLDGDKTNNYVANLKYGSAHENALDKIAHGTQQKGEDHPRSKLTERDIEVIHDALSRDIPQNIIASVFGVYPTLINKINTGKVWSWLHPSQSPSAAV